jgi:uncharacterized protein (TIGR01777 family)
MLPPFKFFVGGPLGSGDQYFPWIHAYDLCRSIIFALENGNFKGPYNASAPNPVTMREFASQLATELRRPSIFRVPEFAIKLVLGEAANPVLSSKRMEPRKLQQHGFEFRFKYLRQALGDIL